MRILLIFPPLIMYPAGSFSYFFSHFSSAYPFFIFFFPLPPTGSHFCLPFPSLPVFHSRLFSFLQISSPCCTFYDCCSLIMIRKFISTIMIFFFFLIKNQIPFWIFKVDLHIKVFVFRLNKTSSPRNRLFHLIEWWEELSICIVALSKIHCYTPFSFFSRRFRVSRWYYRGSFGWSWHTRAAVDIQNSSLYFV